MGRSLRAWVVLVVLAVALLPVPVVALLGALGEAREAQSARLVAQATHAMIALIEQGSSPAAHAEQIARDAGCALAVIDTRTDAILARADHDPRVAQYFGVASIATAPTDSAPALDRSLSQRSIVREASGAERIGACRTLDGGALLLCESAQRSAQHPQWVVYARRSAQSEAQRLAGSRRPLAWLTALVLASGLALGLCLVRRIVAPLERVRAALAARAQDTRAATEPIAIDAPPEIREVIDGYNRVLAALDRERTERESQAADLAHEIKSPLAALRLTVEQAGDPAAIARATAAIGRIDRAVLSLLELARADAGLRDDERASVELRALVENVCATIDGPPQVRCTIEGSAVHATIATEPFARALTAVLDNAVSYARSTVIVRVEREGEWATITVGDDGPGVDAAARERIFDRFFTTRRDTGGTGIGLALARAVLRAHGGTLSLSDRPPPGAAFTLRLPRATDGTDRRLTED